MDGGRRVLRSLTEWFIPLHSPTYAHAAPAASIAYDASSIADSTGDAPLGRLRTLKATPRVTPRKRFASSFVERAPAYVRIPPPASFLSSCCLGRSAHSASSRTAAMTIS